MDKNCNNGISRRSALKRMGLLIAGAACINMPTLTSCNMDTKKRIILYFTGTGNCLYVARELADEHTELLSIPQLVKQNRYTLEADEIGIVYPVYGHMPPNMVREFIKKAHLKAGYKFAILTYGNRKCSSVEIWDDVSRKAGCPFDYITTIVLSTCSRSVHGLFTYQLRFTSGLSSVFLWLGLVEEGGCSGGATEVLFDLLLPSPSNGRHPKGMSISTHPHQIILIQL